MCLCVCVHILDPDYKLTSDCVRLHSFELACESRMFVSFVFFRLPNKVQQVGKERKTKKKSVYEG